MLKISHFHTNTHTETFVPLIICITDDTDGEKCSSRSTKYQVHDVDELKLRLIDVWHDLAKCFTNV